MAKKPKAKNQEDPKINRGTMESLLRRAHIASGHCAISILGVGGLSRPFVSYDPARALERVCQITGSEPQSDVGTPCTDDRDWFNLSAEQVSLILAAPGLPLAPMDVDITAANPPNSRFSPADISAFAAAELALLLNELHLLGIYPPAAKRAPVAHAEKLAKAARKFRDLVTDPATEHLIADWPELADLRARASDLDILSAITADARSAEESRRGASPLEVFIRDRLAPCFQSVYQHKAGVARPGGSGAVGGPFIRFAAACFAEIGLPVRPETVARHLHRKPAPE